jgi:molecular chaperone GrpE
MSKGFFRRRESKVDETETVFTEPAKEQPADTEGNSGADAAADQAAADANVQGHDAAGAGSAEQPLDVFAEEAEGNAASASASAADTLVEQLRRENAENHDKYLRALAEVENVRKRAQKERSELLRYAGENIVRDLLEVLDDLELAGKMIPEGSTEPMAQGFRMIQQKLLAVLDRHSIKAESALGALLDPTKHEALTAVPTADSAPGTILQEFRKAYFFRDKLIRPAQVVVAAALPSTNADQQEEGESDNPDSGDVLN